MNSGNDIVISRVKGQRREVRRMLAARSQKLLSAYRQGEGSGPNCPLRQALLVQV